MEHAAERFGSERVLVTSFTRAAAAELVGRDLPLPRQNIGTLHAHCFRSLGGPEIAEAKIDDWNKDYPEYALSVEKNSSAIDEGTTEQKFEQSGDEVFSHLSSLRARMVERELWPTTVKALDQRWSEWKQANGLMDFTDLLEISLRDIHIAPGDPQVLIADEAQDFSKLQLTLIRKWGRHTEYMLVAGDEDQLLYGWCGCTVDAFLKPPVPENQKRILRQSFRVPRAVHAAAERWINKVAVREPKEYLPRDCDGEVRAHPCSWMNPIPIIADAEKYLAQGKTVMFLAPCSYMLYPLQRELRKAGMPFHNPYRRNRGDWNPLRTTPNSTASRMLAFLRPREDVWGEDAGEWTGESLRRWVEMVKSQGLLTRGSKTRIAAMPPEDRVTIELIAELFEPQAAEEMVGVLNSGRIEECVKWLLDRAVAEKRRAADYPAAVLTNRGPRALVDRPQIIVGTIHSVKGGQADVVYLAPDLSARAAQVWWQGGEQKDGIIRQFYVGMTRARESLVVLREEAAHVNLGVQ